MNIIWAKNLNNGPPLSMNNFDMYQIIEEMGIIKYRQPVLQEAHDTSLAVHAALCKEASDTTSKPTISRSDSSSTSQPTSHQMLTHQCVLQLFELVLIWVVMKVISVV